MIDPPEFFHFLLPLILFLKLYRMTQLMGDTLEGQSYYDKWIDGYHFIVLNTQWDTKDRAYLSPEELNWLDETMAENASSDKPIFVVLHQPLYDTYTNSNAWPDGVQDHQLKEILRKYPQTIMFNGHIHDGIGAVEVVQTDYGTMVDVPGMEKGKTYTVEVVNHEKSNAGNYRDVHAFVVTTGVQDTEEVLVDFSALETLYTENKEKDISGYTESSQETFKTALAQQLL